MKNFLIVGTQRTGSSALAELLGLHPQITCAWESTRAVHPFQKIVVAEEVFSGNFSNLRKKEKEYLSDLHNTNKTALGFRRLFNSSDKWIIHPRYAPALFKDRLEAHLSWLANRRPDVSIIHIVRTDNLAWLKSMGLSSQTGVYIGKKYPDDAEIRWDPKTAEKRVRSKIWLGNRLSSLASSNPYMCVEYESFRSDNSGVLKSVLAFLGFRGNYTAVAPTTTGIQSKSSIAHGFSNWDEIQLHLEQMALLKEKSS